MIERYSSTIIRLTAGSMIVRPKMLHNKSSRPSYDNSNRPKFHSILRNPQCSPDWHTFFLSVADTTMRDSYCLHFLRFCFACAHSPRDRSGAYRETCLRFSWITVSRTDYGASWHHLFANNFRMFCDITVNYG